MRKTKGCVMRHLSSKPKIKSENSTKQLLGALIMPIFLTEVNDIFTTFLTYIYNIENIFIFLMHIQTKEIRLK